MHPIDQLLHEHNLSRNKFSVISGIKPSTVGSYVTRNTPVNNLKVELIVALTKALDTTADEVIKKLFEKENQIMKKFKINAAGAKIYEDVNKHEMLKVPTISDPHNETGAIYDVLSVGILGEQRIPIVTIRETKGIVAYRLPLDLSDWVHHAIALSMEGVKMFPEKVEFGILNNIAYAEIQ